jgi:hypothetical protein
LNRAEIPVRWSDVIVRHTGYVDPALRAKKLQRDSRILHVELNDRPDDPFILFNLGSIAVERQEWQAALGYLRRSLAGSGPWDSITRKLYALIARSHQMLGELSAALRTCADGLAIEPQDAELWFRKGICAGNAASRPRRRRAGGGSSLCGAPSGFAVSTRGSTGMSPGEIWPYWQRNAATWPRRNGCGARSWANAPAIARRSSNWTG